MSCNYNPLPSDLSETTDPSVADIRHLPLIIFWSPPVTTSTTRVQLASGRLTWDPSEAAAPPTMENCHHEDYELPHYWELRNVEQNSAKTSGTSRYIVWWKLNLCFLYSHWKTVLKFYDVIKVLQRAPQRFNKGCDCQKTFPHFNWKHKRYKTSCGVGILRPAKKLEN